MFSMRGLAYTKNMFYYLRRVKVWLSASDKLCIPMNQIVMLLLFPTLFFLYRIFARCGHKSVIRITPPVFEPNMPGYRAESQVIACIRIQGWISGVIACIHYLLCAAVHVILSFLALFIYSFFPAFSWHPIRTRGWQKIEIEATGQAWSWKRDNDMNCRAEKL